MTAKLRCGWPVPFGRNSKLQVCELKQRRGVVPGLVTTFVGNNADSESCVRAKQKAAHELGFFSIQENQRAEISEREPLGLFAQYNIDCRIHVHF